MAKRKGEIIYAALANGQQWKCLCFVSVLDEAVAQYITEPIARYSHTNDVLMVTKASYINTTRKCPVLSLAKNIIFIHLNFPRKGILREIIMMVSRLSEK